ncbi:hypothetical protein [Fimbriiglobus ruber]|uniref:hypothetical protein n=1 Tax=Fimbriiglobus ruber TaxID=1908690 RepID=UPI00117AB00E|nr:hypothetical protein [Fimbriiglobus ruber]
MTWLHTRYPAWSLIRTFIRVKNLVGCRTLDPCSPKALDLKGGKLMFGADVTKTARSVSLPTDIYLTLSQLAGPTWLWEQYTQTHRPHHARRLRPPSPGGRSPRGPVRTKVGSRDSRK